MSVGLNNTGNIVVDRARRNVSCSVHGKHRRPCDIQSVSAVRRSSLGGTATRMPACNGGSDRWLGGL